MLIVQTQTVIVQTQAVTVQTQTVIVQTQALRAPVGTPRPYQGRGRGGVLTALNVMFILRLFKPRLYARVFTRV